MDHGGGGDRPYIYIYIILYVCMYVCMCIAHAYKQRAVRKCTFASCSCTDQELRKLAVHHARALRPKSSTVAEMLGELSFARWIFLRSSRLPLEAQHLIRSFLASPTAELAGRKILGLHDGHDLVFHSVACLPAGKLMCQVRRDFCVDKVWSLADHCASLNCPVSEEAPVALATRGWYDDFCRCDEPLHPLPAEFAVLVPGDASPAGSFFDLMQSAEGWFDDVEVHQGGAKRACPPSLPLDMQLQYELERHCDDEVGHSDDEPWSQRIRRLLRQGANPMLDVTEARSHKKLSPLEKASHAFLNLIAVGASAKKTHCLYPNPKARALSSRRSGTRKHRCKLTWTTFAAADFAGTRCTSS